MGTETYDICQGVEASSYHLVKLNNPLMGTETSLNKYVHLSKNTLEVKLNNPLMGTETISPKIFYIV